MERYAHLQNLPNSPLTPLTPLSENTAFEFNFGGDGSLDVYIDNVRHKHRMEQQQEPMPCSVATMQQHQPTKARKPKIDSPIVKTKRFSENFLKLRDVFEPHSKKASPRQGTFEMSNRRIHLKDPPKHNCQQKKDSHNHRHHQDQPMMSSMQKEDVTPCPVVKIVHTGATPQKQQHDYVTTPTNVRTPLKLRNHNIILTLPQKIRRESSQQQQSHQEKAYPPQQNRRFRAASPVAVRPLSPHISKILHERGLSMYAGVFQREEIDLFTFKMLKVQDLQQMGITNTKHCNTIMSDVYYARQCL